MAEYFLLKVECGLDREAAEAITNHFHNFNLSLPDGQRTICRSWTMLDEENNWQSITQPKGASSNAFFPQEQSDGTMQYDRDDRGGGGLIWRDDTLTDIANALLNHLRTAPPYRYGIVGPETADVFHASSLSEENWANMSGFGFILSDAIWLSIGKPVNFVPFELGYVWRPYTNRK